MKKKTRKGNEGEEAPGSNPNAMQDINKTTLHGRKSGKIGSN
jgi:hypothetical protein